MKKEHCGRRIRRRRKQDKEAEKRLKIGKEGGGEEN